MARLHSFKNSLFQKTSDVFLRYARSLCCLSGSQIPRDHRDSIILDIEANVDWSYKLGLGLRLSKSYKKEQPEAIQENSMHSG